MTHRKADDSQLPLWPDDQGSLFDTPSNERRDPEIAGDVGDLVLGPDAADPWLEEATPVETAREKATPGKPETPPDLVARAAGGFLGLACGDALGAPIEFQSLASVRARHGRITEMIGGGIWKPGEWTDDTGMAVCIAEGILENPSDPVPGTGERFLKWSATAKDVGGTISASLSGFRATGNWARASSSTYQAQSGRAAGNGSLMRTLPVALAYDDMQEMLLHSARLSATTHWDPQAEVCCAIYCLWIRELLAGAGLADGWQTALDQARLVAEKGSLAPDTVGPQPLPEDFWHRFEKIPDLAYEDLQPSGYAGYSVECLEAAAWCALYSTDAEQAITDVVNLAGESDTMGAVAGGVVGAYGGVDVLPERWLKRLMERKRIEKLARRLVALRAASG